MKDTTFAVLLALELGLAITGIYFFMFPVGIIIVVLMFRLISALVMLAYFILQKTPYPSKKNKSQFYKKWVLIIFGILSITSFMIYVYTMFQIMV